MLFGSGFCACKYLRAARYNHCAMKHHQAQHSDGEHLYEDVAHDIARAIEGGALQVGQRVPSVRHLSAQRGVSISTVLQAYRTLENEGLIEARPQSGYFVRRRAPVPPEPEANDETNDEATDISMSALVGQVLRATGDPHLLNLSVAVPGARFIADALHRTRVGRGVAKSSGFERQLRYAARLRTFAPRNRAAQHRGGRRTVAR